MTPEPRVRLHLTFVDLPVGPAFDVCCWDSAVWITTPTRAFALTLRLLCRVLYWLPICYDSTTTVDCRICLHGYLQVYYAIATRLPRSLLPGDIYTLLTVVDLQPNMYYYRFFGLLPEHSGYRR